MHIAELGLSTRRLPELRTFYSEVLGLPVSSDPEGALRVQAGETDLVFAPVGEGDPRYHFAFNIPENQLANAKAWLNERVPLVKSEGQDQFHFVDWEADAIYFQDAAGNLCELIARHTLPNSSVESFGPHSLLSVSEIGLVVEDVHDLRVRLNNELNLEPYFGFSDEFCAVGDENGLFIIVQRGRRWAPDRKVVAEIFPTRIRMSECENFAFDFHQLPYKIEPAPAVQMKG